MTDGTLPLFGDDGAVHQGELDKAFRRAHRVELDEHSWVEHVPGWLTGAETLFEQLRRIGRWDQRQRWMYGERVTEPRLTARYPDMDSAPETLRTAAAALTAHYGVTYNRLWLNLYRHHRDSTGWHGDGASTRRVECVVPVLSLGATRRFLIRPKDGGESLTFRPCAGDLIVMGGRCQSEWRHSVPKENWSTGPRISANFAATSQMKREGEPRSMALRRP